MPTRQDSILSPQRGITLQRLKSYGIYIKGIYKSLPMKSLIHQRPTNTLFTDPGTPTKLVNAHNNTFTFKE